MDLKSLSLEIELICDNARCNSKMLINEPDADTADFYEHCEQTLTVILDNWGGIDADIRRGLYDQVRNAIDIVNTSRLLGRMLKQSKTFDPEIIIHLHNKLINE